MTGAPRGSAPKPAGLAGLGDLVAHVLGGLGIEPGTGCGCDHRRDLLNKMFPFPPSRGGRRPGARARSPR